MLTSVLLLALSQAPQIEAHKVFRGADGQLVDVLTLAPRASNTVWVRVRSADSAHDGLVIPGTMANGTISTTFRGNSWGVMVERGESRSVFIPGRPEFKVKFDQAASDALVRDEVIAAFTAQSSQRALFARREWPALEKKYQAAADALAADFTKSCGKPVALGFDWSSFNDDVMGEVDVWKKCQPTAAAAKKQCPAKLTCKMTGTTIAFAAQ